MAVRHCQYCPNTIPKERNASAIYCSVECAGRASQKRYRQRQAAKRGKVADKPKLNPRESWRLDDLVRELRSTGYDEIIKNQKLTVREVARILNVPSAGQITRAMAEITRQDLLGIAGAAWSRTPEVTRLLGLDQPMPDLLDHDACWKWATYAMERFMEFERRYMSLPNGKPWLRPDFHKLWIKEILFAIASGGYLQILSPPRHGKTELLTHFVVWLIVRDPNIRIIWMGPNEPKAKEVVTKIKEILELHTELIRDTLPPGQTYAPQKRQGGVWQSNTFKVDCRPPGIAGNTFLGIGRGAKILSLNADILIGDDIEDADSTENVTARKKTRRWFSTQWDSRKEEHTAMFLIGSRQHYDDLYGYNIEDPNFRVVINSAHDPDCIIPEENIAAHDECVLFPQLRSFRWLMSKKYGSDARAEDGELGTYEMVYLNDPQLDMSYIFSDELLRSSYNPSRNLGLEGIPKDGRILVAGMDPSATGKQAAVLWALTPIDEVRGASYLEVQDSRYKRWLVDTNDRTGGGVEAAIELWEEWRQLYGVRIWILETNGFQQFYLEDPRTRAWANKTDTVIEPHGTYHNKTDKVFGVSAMKRLWTARPMLVDLPYGNEAAIRTTNSLAKQFKAHSDERAVKGKTDLKMAAWFPTEYIRKLEKQLVSEKMESKLIEDDLYPRSYTGLNRFSDQSTAPWSN